MYLVMAVIETASPLTAPSLSKVTELLMKRMVAANPVDTNTMNKNFILHSITHSNHVLQQGEGVKDVRREGGREREREGGREREREGERGREGEGERGRKGEGERGREREREGGREREREREQKQTSKCATTNDPY